MTKLSDLHKEWMKDPEYRAEYEATEPAFELMRALIGARANSGLTQQEISERMGTTQSAVARLEGWSSNPSVNTLRKYAEATGTRLRIGFEPIGADAVSNGKEGSKSAIENGLDTVGSEVADVDVYEPVDLPT